MAPNYACVGPIKGQTSVTRSSLRSIGAPQTVISGIAIGAKKDSKTSGNLLIVEQQVYYPDLEDKLGSVLQRSAPIINALSS